MEILDAGESAYRESLSMTALLILFCFMMPRAWDIAKASAVKIEHVMANLSIILVSLNITATPTPASVLDPSVKTVCGYGILLGVSSDCWCTSLE